MTQKETDAGNVKLRVEMDAELTAWAREEARRRGLTLSAFVRALLEEEARRN